MRQHDSRCAVQELDGPATSLYERFLWRLFSKDYTLYERYLPFFSDKSKIAEALKALNRPVLIIIDEVLDYVGNGLDGANNLSSPHRTWASCVRCSTSSTTCRTWRCWR